MIGYFWKGEFFGFWRNQLGAEGFIERTISSLGHDPGDVEMITYNYSPTSKDSIIFDEEKKMIVMDITEEEIKIEGVLSTRKVSTMSAIVIGEKVYPK